MSHAYLYPWTATVSFIPFNAWWSLEVEGNKQNYWICIPAELLAQPMFPF